MKKSYRVDEAAAEFDVSKRTVERLIQRGEIESYKVGDSRGIDAQEIERVKKDRREQD